MDDPNYSGSIMELDLGSVKPCLSGPKRPHDRVEMDNMKADFSSCLTSEIGFKGFGLDKAKTTKTGKFKYEGTEYEITHGSVLIAAITSCTNTSNPDVMLAAGMIAQKAVERGLKVAPYIKTSLSPGSGVVSKYFEISGVNKYLDQLGFTTAGYGCMTCIGNSGELPVEITDCVTENDLVASAVLSGNRNFEGRVHQYTRANYLASPPLVVAYALAGRIDIDFDTEPIGQDQDGKDVFLNDLWPSREEVQKVTGGSIKPSMFKEAYSDLGGQRWKDLDAGEGKLYEWDENSTYIHNPPFFQTMEREPNPISSIDAAHCLLNLGDSITTDHISPAGKIASDSPAAAYLKSKGVKA